MERYTRALLLTHELGDLLGCHVDRNALGWLTGLLVLLLLL